MIVAKRGELIEMALILFQLSGMPHHRVKQIRGMLGSYSHVGTDDGLECERNWKSGH